MPVTVACLLRPVAGLGRLGRSSRYNSAAVLSLALWATCLAPGRATEPRTMRLDYYHTGNAQQELFAVDAVVIEPLAWAGNPLSPTDELNLGSYRFEVVDPTSGRLLYSRGFDSVYREWASTEEAKSANRTFHESLRFPAPESPVRIRIRKRDHENQWCDAWSINIDPHDMFVDTAIPDSPGELIAVEENGPPATKADLLILGDGYTLAERSKFEGDTRRLVARLFQTSPFKERRKDFNVWALCPPARESGISRPSTGVHRASPLGTSYDAFGSERYVLTFDNRALRRIAEFAPYDAVAIVINGRTYGGGGIFGQYSTTSADSAWAPYIFVHEFGHHFAGLADEYFTSPVAYQPAEKKVEPWEPNVTALLDPSHLKWQESLSAGTPLPTPWQKDAFETVSREFQARRVALRKDKRPEEDMEALFTEEKKVLDKMLGAEPYAGKVGAFEGAMYESQGYFRPEANCIMFTRADYFCAPCRKAIERVIDSYTRSSTIP